LAEEGKVIERTPKKGGLKSLRPQVVGDPRNRSIGALTLTEQEEGRKNRRTN